MKERSIIFKTYSLLAITVILLLMVSILSFNSVTRFNEAIDEIDDFNKNASLTERIFSKLSALETSARSYVLTLNDEDYGDYFFKAQEIKEDIDSLVLYSANKSYRRQADTLRLLFAEKLRSYDALINYKIRQRRNSVGAASLKYIEDNENALLSDTVVSQRSKIVERVVPDSLQEKPGFFKRVFGKTPEPKTIKETVIEYDTLISQQSNDTLLKEVKEVLAREQKAQIRQIKRLANKEMDLVDADQLIVLKLRELMADIRAIERKEINQRKQEAATMARSSFQQIVVLALVGTALVLLLVFFVIRDIRIAERLRKDLQVARNKAEELGKAKEEFLANMSHEIRTPLNAVIGFTDQLKKQKLPTLQAKKVDLIQQSGNHLLMLVNDILDFSKIEAGKLRLENIGFKPRHVALESIENVKHMVSSKSVRLTLEDGEVSSDLLLYGDPYRFKQVLLNLLSNAIKFTNEGEVKLQLKATQQGEQAKLYVAVIDTGKGIAEDKQQSIFEGFNQEDNTITRKFGGTGLGLSISNSILTMQGSQLELKSTIGEGSTFYFTVDYPIAQEDEYLSQSKTNNIKLELKGKKLLIIDDDKMNHLLLKPFIEEEGLEATSCYDGADGAELAQESYFDFIFVDMQMPGLSGPEVIDAIKATDSASKDSFVLLCTANVLVRQQKHPVLNRVDGMLLKPFRENELRAAFIKSGKGVTNDATKYGTPAPEYSLQHFRAFASGDETMLREFIVSFIDSGNATLKEMHEALDGKDYKQLGELAHKLKNTFAQLEAKPLVALLKEMEAWISTDANAMEAKSKFKLFETGAKELFKELRRKELDG